MLEIPKDLEFQCASGTTKIPEACVIRYEAREMLSAIRALVTRPTFVLVCAGLKQLKPLGEEHILTAPTGSILAMRSGIHVMSEFHGQHEPYRSIILSVDRSFLREAVGIPKTSNGGPQVVVSSPSVHAKDLFAALPDALDQQMPDIERQFKLRELLVALMGDIEVRQLVLREAADWGSRDEERLVSMVKTHSLSPINLPDFAKLCAMSISSFKRRFQHIYGVPPAKWLTRVRLEHARSILLNGDLSVSDICRCSGFRDVSSFIRVFRRNYGDTPAALRKKHRESGTIRLQ